jgi:hypothetical protein
LQTYSDADEDSEYENFAEAYKLKQEKMLGELQSIYQEKNSWADQLKLAIDSSEEIAPTGLDDTQV